MKFLFIMLTATVFSGPLTYAQSESVGRSETFTRPYRSVGREEYKPSIGVRTGVADTESHYDAAWDWAVEAGFQPVVPFGVALELGGYASDRSAAAGLTRTEFLAKGTYNFGGDTPLIRYSYFGVGLGPVFDNVAGSRHVSFGLEPLLGFDIPLTRENEVSHFTLGANASYLFVNNTMPDAFALNGVAKYWF